MKLGQLVVRQIHSPQAGRQRSLQRCQRISAEPHLPAIKASTSAAYPSHNLQISTPYAACYRHWLAERLLRGCGKTMAVTEHAWLSIRQVLPR